MSRDSNAAPLHGVGPALTLPEVPHLPGRTPRPPESLFAPLKQGLTPALPPGALAASPAFRAGLHAFIRRYYWEAHEFWEAVWACLPPAGAERLFLRGLIQLANAGLKARMGRPAAAVKILALADAALAEAGQRHAGILMGLTRERLVALRQQAATDSP